MRNLIQINKIEQNKKYNVQNQILKIKLNNLIYKKQKYKNN